jgi:hypothetical protein
MTGISGTAGAYGVSSPHVPSSEERSVASGDQSGPFEREMAAAPPAPAVNSENETPPRKGIWAILNGLNISRGTSSNLVMKLAEMTDEMKADISRMQAQPDAALQRVQEAIEQMFQPDPPFRVDLPNISGFSIETATKVRDLLAENIARYGDSRATVVGGSYENQIAQTLDRYMAWLDEHIGSQSNGNTSAEAAA